MHAVSRRFAAPARRAAAALRRFRAHRGGTAAIEFAIVFLPFAAFLFAIMETAIVFFASQVLETNAADAARLVLTGQAQGGGYTQASFKSAVCQRMTGMFDCTNKLSIDVRKFSDFAAINLTAPLNANCTLSNFVYQPGGPGDIVVVRLIYQWPIGVWLWNPNIADNCPGHSKLLVATAAFRNEPY